MMERLAAVVAVRMERKSAAYDFFRPTADGEHVVLLTTNEVLGWDAFFERVEERPETAFVPIMPLGVDDEEAAYWEERDAAAPTWEDLQRENAWSQAPEAERSPEPPAWERQHPHDHVRAARAEAYAERLRVWEMYFEEIARRVASNQEMKART